MSNAMKELIKQEVARERTALQIENVRNMVKNLNLTTEEAMNALAIPTEEQAVIKKRMEEEQ